MAKKRKKMDKKLAAKLQKHEVAYIAKKFCTDKDTIKAVINAVGHSRRKIYEYLRARRFIERTRAEMNV